MALAEVPPWLTLTPQNPANVSPRAGVGSQTIQVAADMLSKQDPTRYGVFFANDYPTAVVQGAGLAGYPWHAKALPAPTIETAGGMTTCSLAVSGARLFMAMDLYAGGARVAHDEGAGGVFTLSASATTAADLRCVVFSIPNGFVVSQAGVIP